RSRAAVGELSRARTSIRRSGPSSEAVSERASRSSSPGEFSNRTMPIRSKDTSEEPGPLFPRRPRQPRNAREQREIRVVIRVPGQGVGPAIPERGQLAVGARLLPPRRSLSPAGGLVVHEPRMGRPDVPVSAPAELEAEVDVVEGDGEGL